jgi:hypothetical protein
MSAIEICRTAVLGGHIEGCEGCGHRRIAPFRKKNWIVYAKAPFAGPEAVLA